MYSMYSTSSRSHSSVDGKKKHLVEPQFNVSDEGRLRWVICCFHLFVSSSHTIAIFLGLGLQMWNVLALQKNSTNKLVSILNNDAHTSWFLP